MGKLKHWVAAIAALGITTWLSYEVLTDTIGDPEEGRRRTRSLKEGLYWLSDTLTPLGAAAALTLFGILVAAWYVRLALRTPTEPDQDEARSGRSRSGQT